MRAHFSTQCFPFLGTAGACSTEPMPSRKQGGDTLCLAVFLETICYLLHGILRGENAHLLTPCFQNYSFKESSWLLLLISSWVTLGLQFSLLWSCDESKTKRCLLHSLRVQEHIWLHWTSSLTAIGKGVLFGMQHSGNCMKLQALPLDLSWTGWLTQILITFLIFSELVQFEHDGKSIPGDSNSHWSPTN